MVNPMSHWVVVTLSAGLPGMVAGAMVTKQVICVCDLGYYGKQRTIAILINVLLSGTTDSGYLKLDELWGRGGSSIFM